MKVDNPIVVKCAGGATAQLLALVNAIHLSIKLNRPFKVKYFPYSTGTYWPFAIGKLLEENEVMEEGNTKGLDTSGLKSGEFIANFPLRRRGLSYERFLQVIHRLHLHNTLNILRGEVVIGGKRKKLEQVNTRTSLVSGNFVPLINREVFTELSHRFNKANLPNPFDVHDKKAEFVIHYRLGDMRKIPSRDAKMGGHGVVDPTTFRKILELENIDVSSTLVKVVSDEPELAVRVLKDVNISAISESKEISVWKDLQTISSAKIFIGSLSQFSFFGAIICAYNGGKPYLPSTIYGSGNLEKDFSISLFNYFEYNYLQKNHYLFHNV